MLADGLALVLLHGRGHDPESMQVLARRAGMGDARVVAPAAPEGTWYPERFRQPRAANEPHLSEAVATVHAALDELEADGVPPWRIVLGGFSQGACLAAEALAQRPRQLAALVVLCGGLIGADDELTAPPDGSIERLPVLLTGVEDDGWVPVARVRRTHEVLARAGARVDLLVLPPAEHEIHAEEVAAMRRLLDGVAAAL